LFSKYLEGDSKGETIFRCMEEYLQEQNISLENITAVATDGVHAMVGGYRGFATLLKQNVPHVVTVHCVLHRTHLVAKKLSGELNEALMICIRSINKIKAHKTEASQHPTRFERFGSSTPNTSFTLMTIS